ncbi:aromatic ring-hydroxylating oxygenase subunit alpha [Paraliomyxa miuraensis]|uniref:aromatic ring-hydroxylating oxygenase subunit alpha n=1 Tax=Paraliomyxa miuraensis TaxID=376150 RepID=UPI002258CB59|nr:aromatic ring-hydroxylating dioxygenase subunit alpha [Paraliomyxa miuraensis]MCX4245011.1 aromatic ring-hydroxylating dioxygenase subunit alpha [Paraliomyxa miuraensis]
MFPTDCWYAILDARELRRARPLYARRLGVELALWRDEQGRARCVLDRCPHRGASLSAGKIREGCLECPFHGFVFDGRGACVEVPCNGPDAPRARHLDTRAFEIREAQGLLWLWWGQPRESYPPTPWFEVLDGRYEFVSFELDTEVNWMRNVEAQLDWAHVPFVHRKSFGATFPRVLDIHSAVEGDLLTTWRGDQTDGEGKPTFSLRLLLPGLWMMPYELESERACGLIAYAPVDDVHTRVYFRSYVQKTAIPGLARLIGMYHNFYSRRILREDLRVVLTQPPGPTAHVHDERLVPADLPVAHFRREVARRSQPGVELGPRVAVMRRSG